MRRHRRSPELCEYSTPRSFAGVSVGSPLYGGGLRYNLAARDGKRRSGRIRMLVLRSAEASPFGRKVRIAAAMLGLATASRSRRPTPAAGQALMRQNPLGKIPALILPAARFSTTARSSSNISTGSRAGARSSPPPRERFRSLSPPALADGIMEAAILLLRGLWRDAASLGHWTATSRARSIGRSRLSRRPPGGDQRHRDHRAGLRAGLSRPALRRRWRPGIPASSAGWTLSQRQSRASKRPGSRGREPLSPLSASGA